MRKHFALCKFSSWYAYLLRWIKLATLIVFGSIGSIYSSAEMLVWQMSGTINSVNQTKAFWNDSVRLGTPFSVTTVFDNGVQDSHDSSQLGYYSDASFKTTLTFGSYRFSNRTTYINVLNDRDIGVQPRDGYSWLSFDFAQEGLTNITMQGHLHTWDTTFLTSDALAIHELAVSTFDIQRDLSLTAVLADESGTVSIGGTVLTYSVTVIPEPGTISFLLLSAALAGIRLVRTHSK